MTKQETSELIRLLKKLSDTSKDVQIKFKSNHLRSILETKNE
jgi:hypothetical protein